MLSGYGKSIEHSLQAGPRLSQHYLDCQSSHNCWLLPAQRGLRSATCVLSWCVWQCRTGWCSAQLLEDTCSAIQYPLISQQAATS